MTEEQAKEYITKEYTCCCIYGDSPTNCSDEKCEFGQAIRALIEERPQGEWIDYSNEGYVECPFCHHSFTYWGNFCGNCGADVRGGKNEQ